MASKVDLQEYLTGCDSGLRDMTVQKQWAESVGPYHLVVRFFPPGSSGYAKAAELKIANKSVFDVSAIIQEIEKQVTETVGTSPLGRFHLLFSDGKLGVMFQRQRQIAAAGDDGGNLSVELLRSMLAEERLRTVQLTQLISGSYSAQIGAMANQSQSIAALATQRSVSSSAADSGGISGMMGMVALVIGYPMLKQSLGLPKDATVEQTVRAVQLGVERWQKAEARGMRAEEVEAKVIAPPGATDPAQINEVKAEDADEVLLYKLKSDKEWREQFLAKAFSDEELSAEAMKAFLNSKK